MEELKAFAVTLFWVLLFCAVALFLFLKTILPYLACVVGMVFLLATKPPKGNGR
jgi:hypothetical protein